MVGLVVMMDSVLPFRVLVGRGEWGGGGERAHTHKKRYTRVTSSVVYLSSSYLPPQTVATRRASAEDLYRFVCSSSRALLLVGDDGNLSPLQSVPPLSLPVLSCVNEAG